MSEKIAYYLNKLNNREKALLAVLNIIFAVFLALYFQDDSKNLNDTTNLKDLQANLSEQREKIEDLNSILKHFKPSYKNILDELYSLAQQHSLAFLSIKNSSNQEKYINKYTILIELESDFSKIIYFIQALQGSKYVFLMPEISLNKEENLLKAQIKLELLSLKD
ncbi:hypothetical protein [Campylobacter avium]|uniref:hypothetical protein n=1 Tax=Campylobacter avium TaxID=522485 RepID=UPI002352061F|nr:hypothetical protein [Campylobacter avium]